MHDLTIPGEAKETEQGPDPKSDKQVTRSGRVVKTPELQKQVGSLRTSSLIKEEYFCLNVSFDLKILYDARKILYSKIREILYMLHQ